MKLAYFVHDLSDPAVARRLRMLKAGGAQPVVLGFCRAETAPETLEGCPTVDLGRTYDARLGHRARMTALTALKSRRFRRLLAGAEVVMARQLEMLAIAQAARWTCGLRARLVYEALDVHRIMVQDTVKGLAMRNVEKALLKRTDLLVVSSPAFVDAYFRPIQGLGDDLQTPVMLVENKVLELGGRATPQPSPASGRPWRINWMGAIRCRKSLDILTALAARRPDLLEVRIHGRPAYTEFADFDGQVAAVPNVTFGGAYTAADLPRLYGETHFCWAIDFMEEGLNSAWLLPNRLYESARYGCVPVALQDVQTGRYLADHGFGVRLARPEDLEGFLETLTPDRYAALKAELAAQPLSAFRADESDCRRLVEGLKKPSAPVGSNSQAAESSPGKLAA
ncbi:glycosyl transferase family 1 [Phenylobacterium sp.]|uniref:glycosyl transferase family 1 n=1 Tax=Phenylobacterium sp. TaxID=1871053 RepID=UPI0028114EDC|nr:glycosyl transferase family 1 [Phenylobacterium sp.]